MFIKIGSESAQHLLSCSAVQLFSCLPELEGCCCCDNELLKIVIEANTTWVKCEKNSPTLKDVSIVFRWYCQSSITKLVNKKPRALALAQGSHNTLHWSLQSGANGLPKTLNRCLRIHRVTARQLSWRTPSSCKRVEAIVWTAPGAEERNAPRHGNNTRVWWPCGDSVLD